MSIEFELDSLITIFVTGGAVLSSFYFGIRLLGKENRTRANIFLGGLLILGALTILNNLFAHVGIYSRFKNLYFIPLYYTLSFGPLTYFYVRTKINPSFQFRRLHLIHAILPVAQAVFFFSVGFRDYEFKEWLWQHVIGPWYQDTEGLLFVGTFLAYTFSAGKRVLKEKEKAHSDWKQIQGKWLLRFLNVFVVLVAIEFAYDITNYILWNFYEVNLYNIPWASFPLDMSKALAWYWVALNGFQNANPEIVLPPKKQRKERYNLGENDIEEQLATLEAYFETEKSYLNPDINLNMVARELGITPNKVSFILNEGKKVNFNDYVNELRVEEVKKRLVDPAFSNYTILSIALDAGFNSKATFNRVFKAKTGITPRQYVEEHQ